MIFNAVYLYARLDVFKVFVVVRVLNVLIGELIVRFTAHD